MELSSGNVYNFSVAGVDKRDIIGLFSEPLIIDLSAKYLKFKITLFKINLVPGQVTNLQHNISYIGYNYVNSIVHWNVSLGVPLIFDYKL